MTQITVDAIALTAQDAQDIYFCLEAQTDICQDALRCETDVAALKDINESIERYGKLMERITHRFNVLDPSVR